MGCYECKEEKPGRWFTGNGPSIGYQQTFVCDTCYEKLENDHAASWAKEIAGHNMLKTWHKPSILFIEKIRKNTIELLLRGNAYSET